MTGTNREMTAQGIIDVFKADPTTAELQAARAALVMLAKLALKTMASQERWRNLKDEKSLVAMRRDEKTLTRECKAIVASGGQAQLSLEFGDD